MLVQLRQEAETRREVGPLVVLCGSSVYGKKVIGRSLCSYAARSGWKPLLVDLDNSPSQMVGIPGSVGTAIVEYPIVLDEVISQTHFTFSFYTGSLEAQYLTQEGLSIRPSYQHFSSLLLDVVMERLQAHAGTTYGPSGAVIILPDLAGGSGAHFVSDLAESKKYPISHILCCGDDYLFHKLYSRFCQNVPPAQVRTRVDKISPSYVTQPTVPASAALPRLFTNFFDGEGSTNLSHYIWQKTLNRVDIYVIRDDERKKQPVLLAVEKEALEGFVGCIAALYTFKHSQNLLTASPFAMGKINSVDGAGVHFLTSTPSPPDRLCAIVGSVRWLVGS